MITEETINLYFLQVSTWEIHTVHVNNFFSFGVLIYLTFKKKLVESELNSLAL
jgi:hypothetical protein